MLNRRLHAKLILLLLTSLLGHAISPTHNGAATALAWPNEWLADSAFYTVWSRADEPIASGAAARSWLWGPAPFAVANEPYAESSTGTRLVEYLDKARMEINNPRTDRKSPWFVTSGLLVYEMVTGKVQTGNNRFEARSPAALPVAGDGASPSAPTYATFAGLTGPAPEVRGRLAGSRVSRDGSITPLTGPNAPNDPTLFGITHYDDVSKHNVPAVFRNWMLQRGRVLEGGRLIEGQLLDPLYVLGRPVTEAYWADVLVSGKPATVLVQLFERRALTYNPSNPPAWRVEMANVGRAYYDWRYASKPPAPAVAAEVGREAVRVRGWNWPPGGSVRLEVDLAGGAAPLTAPQTARADAAGRFVATIATSQELQGALLAGANVHVKAQAGTVTVAIPVAGRPLLGNVFLEGKITQASGPLATPNVTTLAGRDGQSWVLTFDTNSSILYSEGSPASRDAIVSGSEVAVSGEASGGSVRVTEMRLMSVSRTGAHFGYTIQPDGRSIRVSGTRWPARKSVAFSFAPLNSEGGPAIKTATVDSRGNLTALITLPGGNAITPGAFWLFAVAADSTGLLAQVALPFDPPSSARDNTSPPSLYLQVLSGEQRGGLGSYCWRGLCADTAGVPIPEQPIAITIGETIAFRSQYGPDPETGLSPSGFSAQLYNYDAPPGQVTRFNDTLTFTPKGQPVFTTPTLPGRPFSLSLPPSVAPAKYVLILSVKWLDPTGGTGDAQYGFMVVCSR